MQFDVWMQDNLLNSLSKSIVNFLAWSTQILPCLKHSNTASPEALKYCLARTTQILPRLKHSNTASPEALKYCLAWTTQILPRLNHSNTASHEPLKLLFNLHFEEELQLFDSSWLLFEMSQHLLVSREYERLNYFIYLILK